MTDQFKVGDNIHVGCRPEHCSLSSKGLAGQIDIIERLGETGYAHVRLANGQPMVIEVRGEPPVGEGRDVHIAFSPKHIHLFDNVGQRIE